MPRLLLALLLCFCLPLSAAQRVISLAPSLSEIMLELGADDLLVGVLDGGERPAALRHLPSVGSYGKLELETLLSLKPDLILLWPGSVTVQQRAQLAGFGIELYVGEPVNLQQLASQFEAVGERIGRPQAGRKLAARFRAGLQRLHDDYRREPPLSVFYQVWHQPLYTVGGQQIISDALRVCGAENVFADLALPAPQVGIEGVLQRDPAVILGGSDAELGHWQAWPQLAAVRRKQLLRVPDKGLERPSFQMLAATEKLCALLAKAR